MTNKHEARKPDTKPVVWARSELGTAWFYAGSGRPDTNKRAGLGQKIRHGRLARHGPFTYKPVKPAFRPGFFMLNGPARLSPLRAGLRHPRA